MRKNGVLLPIFSLPSDYGIGSLGKECVKFIDFLSNSGVNVWQILPVNPTSFGDSPYQSFSTFAGNPYFIDLDLLVEDGFLLREDLPEKITDKKIDYAALYKERFALLKKAFNYSFESNHKKVEEFCQNNPFVQDYALFMAIKDSNFGMPWYMWEDDYKFRTTLGMKKALEIYHEDVNFYKFLQYLFFLQWTRIKNYANSKSIEILGDLPIYVALDSADVWANPQNYLLDEELAPKEVAGVPPDYFSEDGQLWGNPIYDYEKMAKSGFDFWVERIKFACTLYDIVRIDHFIGFANYYSIPKGSKTAKVGEWKKGYGDQIFKEVHKKIGKVNVIAENLGVISQASIDLIESLGFPGMEVLQFSFDEYSGRFFDGEKISKNTVIYTGTHDNDTLLGWFESLDERAKEYVLTSCKIEEEKGQNVVLALIKRVLDCNANLVIVPLQDYLQLPTSARINVPGTKEGNWQWRLDGGEFNDNLSKKIKELLKQSGRCSK